MARYIMDNTFLEGHTDLPRHQTPALTPQGHSSTLHTSCIGIYLSTSGRLYLKPTWGDLYAKMMVHTVITHCKIFSCGRNVERC